jgi:hypothetical protein
LKPFFCETISNSSGTPVRPSVASDTQSWYGSDVLPCRWRWWRKRR